MLKKSILNVKSWSKYISLWLACLLFLTASFPVQAQTVTSTIIPYLGTGYKYNVVSYDDGSGFEQPGFDDSGFSSGNAGFGSQDYYCSLNNPTDAKTFWPTYTDILLRKEFSLTPGATNLKVGVAIDNDVQVFINGFDISGGLQTHESCPTRDSFVFNAPNDILKAGTNLIAVRGRDRGAVSYLDVQVTADIPLITEVSIDIKPSSYPNSINLGSEGNVPVAIFGSATFDATTVNPLTITLAGAAVNLKGKGTPMASIEDINGDGYVDLVVHVSTDALDLQDTDTVAVLEGQTYDGILISGTDTVRIVPPV